MFEFTLEGIVANGEDLTLALHTSDKGLDERSTTKIQNGKFLFRGTSEQTKRLIVRFEDDVKRVDDYMMFSVYTEPGTTTVKFTVSNEADAYRFSDFEVLNGPKNKLVRTFFKDLADATGKEANVVYSHSRQIDDDKRSMYANARSRIFKVYDKYFEKDVSGVHVYFLKFMTDKLHWPGVFEKSQLSTEEIDKIKVLFSKINSSLSKNVDYQIVNASIDHIINPDKKINFMDYQLESIDGKKEKLSELIEDNKFTILDFWHTNCGRCRAFNKSMNSEYETLRNLSIAIVGINVDDSKNKWRSSTLEDEIPWPSLYAGRTSDILARYSIMSFPTNRVYDKNLNFVNISIENKSELWNWVKDGIKKK